MTTDRVQPAIIVNILHMCKQWIQGPSYFSCTQSMLQASLHVKKEGLGIKTVLMSYE